MPNLERREHDLAVVQVAPTDTTSIKVPTAEEFAHDALIRVVNASREGVINWWDYPAFTLSASPRTLTISGQLETSISPLDLPVSGDLVIPELANNISTVNQQSYLSLINFVAEVGQENDPVLGEFEFSYVDDTTGTIELARQENSRRYRSFWVLVLGDLDITPETFLASIPTEDVLCPSPLHSDNTSPVTFLRLSIPDESVAIADGFTLGTSGIQVYALDPNLRQGTAYTVIPDAIQVTPVASIQRRQNYPEEGYIWGNDGEEDLTPEFAIQVTAKRPKLDVETDAKRRIKELMGGLPGPGFITKRTVQNLLAGSVAGNPSRPGISANAPNGSVGLSNDQRISFTNQRHVSKLAMQIINAANDGDGNALITATLNSNTPLGTTFSERDEDHQVWSLDGTNQSSFGTFRNLGNALQWSAGANATVAPGSTIYFVPGIDFPAGSGMSVPFSEIEGVWISRSGSLQAISAENIRDGAVDDLESYADPLNNEEFIVIHGKERAALHYIYKKLMIVSDINGVAVVPATERGVFAFIDGVVHPETNAARLDIPVVTGLAPETTYKALIYHPPRSSTEQWQVQAKYPAYQGLGQNAIAILDGATVIGEPILYAHTQGGGSSVHKGEGTLQYSPISMHLPKTGQAAIKHYDLDSPIVPLGDAFDGPDTLRSLTPNPGNGLVLPHIGMELKGVANSESYLQSMAVNLTDKDGRQVGYRTPRMANAEYVFQSVLAFPVEKEGDRYLVVTTYNGAGGHDLPLDTKVNCGIDLFEM